MATGDSSDILARVKAVLPRRWFQWVAPYRDAVLGGLSDSAAWCYSWISYARLQVRLKTATGPWLDIASRDFLGTMLPRKANESDAKFSVRLIKEILRPRNTRAAILQTLLDQTGNAAQIQEPWNPYDWGGYGLGYSGYGVAGGYGSLAFNNQVFVKAVRPNGAGVPNIAGYGVVTAGYGSGQGMYTDLSQVTGPVTDAEIYANVARTVSAGNTAWVAIVSPGSQGTGQMVLIGPQTTALAIMQSWF